MRNAKSADLLTSPSLTVAKAIPGFIAPCEPVRVAHPPRGAGWIHEISDSGYRLIARRNDDGITVWNRKGTNVVGRFKRIASAIQMMSVSSITLDGEATVILSNGCHDASLRSKAVSNDAVMLVFDLLELNGRDIRDKSLRRRRDILAKLLADTGDQLIFSEAFVSNGDVVFQRVRNMGFKGIVSKRIDRPYQSGPSTAWVKTTLSSEQALR